MKCQALFDFFRKTGAENEIDFSGLQIRVRIEKLFSLFLIQNICCGFSKEPSQ